jgi:hypothetical protein
MYRRKVPITNIQGVAAGQVATIDLPTDRRYHEIALYYTESGAAVTVANMKTAITSIRISLNSRVQREYSAAELFAINAVNGDQYAAAPSFIPIYFSEPWRRSAGGEDLLAWALEGQGIDSFQIEVTIAAGRVSPALSGRAIIDNARAPDGSMIPLAPIVTTRRRSVDVSATGVRTLIDMPRNLGAYERLHCFEDTAGDISNVRVTVDQMIAFDLGDDLNDDLLDAAGFVPQAGIFHVVFDETQRVGDALPMVANNGRPVAELQLDFTMVNASAFTMVSELIGGAA